MGLLDGIIRVLDAYDGWYDKHRAVEAERENWPKCPFCRNRDYIRGNQTLVNSRIKSARVRATVQCRHCGMRFQASRYPDSKRWTFNDSM